MNLKAQTENEGEGSGAGGKRRGSYAPEVTRKRLLEVSLRLFSDRGFHATTVKTISQEAGVTKGAFYHHFESKEDVLRQIHAEYAGEMVLGAREIAARDDLAPAARLEALIERAVVTLGNHRAHVAVFYQENRFLSGRSYVTIRQMHDEQEQILLDTIDRAITAGEVRPEIDPKLLMFAISGMTAWIYQWYQPDGNLPLDGIARHLARIILDPVVSEPPT